MYKEYLKWFYGKTKYNVKKEKELIFILKQTIKENSIKDFSRKNKLIIKNKFREKLINFFSIKDFPKNPRCLHYQWYMLSGYSEKESKEIIFNRQSVTLEKMRIRYGIEEGNKRWYNYCKKQAKTNTFEYKKEKYGWSKKKFYEYNKSRSVTKENLIKKHGKEKGIEIWINYLGRQEYTNSLKYYIEKYGEENGVVKWKEYNKSKASCTEENYIRKYGKREGILKYEKRIKDLVENYKSVHVWSPYWDAIQKWGILFLQKQKERDKHINEVIGVKS